MKGFSREAMGFYQVGTAERFDDGSITVKVVAFPVDGALYISPPRTDLTIRAAVNLEKLRRGLATKGNGALPAPVPQRNDEREMRVTYDARVDPEAYVVETVDGNVIAHVFAADSSPEDLADAKADAELFVAAPKLQRQHDELLDALKWVMPLEKDCARCRSASGRCIAHAAIAHVEGRP